MTERRAACACGQLELTTRSDPVRVSVCHCFDCQRRTGSAFGAQARFPKASVSIEGESRESARRADSGNHVRFHFCPGCGSTVYWIIGGLEDFLMIPVGAFADPRFPTPTVSIYEDRRHDWLRLVPEDAFTHID